MRSGCLSFQLNSVQNGNYRLSDGSAEKKDTLLNDLLRKELSPTVAASKISSLFARLVLLLSSVPSL